MKHRKCAVAAAAFLLAAVSGGPASAQSTTGEAGWILSQSGRDMSFNTATGRATIKGVTAAGLMSVSRVGGREILKYWEEGAYRATVTLDGESLIDGHDLNDVARISGFRMDRQGSSVHIRISKGPKAKVELIQDGHKVLEWPRLQIVNVLAYKKEALTVSVFDKKAQRTEFFRYRRGPGGGLLPDEERIGSLSGCAVLSTKVLNRGIGLQVYCDPARGSDIVLLDFVSGEIEAVKATEADEFFAFELEKERGSIPVLSVSGSDSARQAFHALSGALLSNLGEPMARASDEAGKQSWSQSYRTMVLAELFRKSGHPVFAELAVSAMRATLKQQNSKQTIGGTYNPSCAWASRIYSTDRRSPVSFMINQAMISGSLLRSCEALGEACPLKLQQAIGRNAQCLVSSYEPYFDEQAGLYRIPYGAPFRFDGLWAPWNWHLSWAVVLERVGETTKQPALVRRAHDIAARFVQSWEIGQNGALWRYWAAPYYDGWTEADKVSLHRPKQKARAPKRYEDINHAGISLLGLSALSYRLGEAQEQGIARTLDRLLAEGAVLPRDLDGKGPRSPRWLPGAGWHAYASETMRRLHTRKLPGSVSSDQHLAYAMLFDPAALFSLDLAISQCGADGCRPTRSWSFDSLRDFISRSPLFSVTRAP
ncbi:hypothetical protein [Pelagibius sp. Alg239-R121]|uniref:hypothetical protein n=1 Tax=Pelagibius sp. Alg239-R121 TaxID=2993448 RepID=UPI0024A77EA8|nr:hypothetical protein [Pelagibius sp. Alg239-R121]